MAISMTSDANLYLIATNTALADFEYFAERCVYIRNKQGDVVPLKFNRVQKKFIKAIKEQEDAGKPILIIIVKARQMGISTVIQVYFLWRMLRRDNTNAIEIAHEKEAASKILEINKFAIDHLPEWFKAVKDVKQEYDTKYEITFAENKSSLTVASAEGREPGRSKTIHLGHLSEAAFYPDYSKIVRPLFQAIPTNKYSAIFEESTGNGPQGGFYERFMRTWNAQKAGRQTAWKALFFPWYEHDEYQMPVPEGVKVHCPPELEHLNLTREQLYWREWTIENKCDGDEDAFRLEYPATVEEAFITKDATVFNPRAILKRLEEVENIPYQEGFLSRHTASSPVQFFPQIGERLKVFKPPEKDHSYIIGADTGSGVVVNREGDFSSADVLDCITGEQVAHLHVVCEPSSYAQDLFFLGLWYNNALIGIEADGHGLSAMSWLRDHGYYRIYQRKVFDKISNQWVDKLGLITTNRTKKFLVDNLRADFYSGSVIVNCKETVQEMSTFVKVAGKSDVMQAVSGAHDDRVMSLCFANQLRREYANIFGSTHVGASAPGEQQVTSQPDTLANQIRRQYLQRANHPELGVYY